MSAALLEANLQKALDNIFTAVPVNSDSNTDGFMHDLFVSKRAEGYFKKRADAAKAALKENGFLDGMPEPGNKAVLYQGDAYILQAAVNQPTKTLDKSKLMTVLATKFGMKAEEITAMIEECSKENKPAEKIDAVPIG